MRLAPDLELDVSGQEPFGIARGVKLVGWRSASPPPKAPRAVIKPRPPGTILDGGEARTPSQPGPRIYSTNPNTPRPAFFVRCYPDGAQNDNVRISGFRLEGPAQGIVEDDSNHPIGIQVVSCINVEITNMEIFGWAGSGIYVIDKDVRKQINPDQVRIHGNFFHHNQHRGREGYGVVVQDGAWASIERNVFDFNRHAIAASGDSGGYRAAWNLVLKGGGYHKFGFQTHQFDIHGNDNCGVIGLVNDSSWNCGRAAQQFWFIQNAFQYLRDNGIKIRGTPQINGFIERNVFAHGEGDEAIGYTQGTRNITVSDNVKQIDTFGQYGVCDFDGDGRDDLFLATGASWWFASGGTRQWTYLFDATERLDRLRLGYIDGDGRCDVLAQGTNGWSLSSGGSGEWRSIGNFGVPLAEVLLGRFGTTRDHRPGVKPMTHAFRRAPNGQWYVTPLSGPAWQPVNSSGVPLEKLRLGDFTGDGISDVLAVVGGKWSISASATSPWQPLNSKLSTAVENLVITDVNNDNTDDLVAFSGGWLVSWGGRSDWVRLKSMSVTLPNGKTYAFGGRFDAVPGTDLLIVDSDRWGNFLNGSGVSWRSNYPY